MLILVTGEVGSERAEVGRGLASRLGIPFHEAADARAAERSARELADSMAVLACPPAERGAAGGVTARLGGGDGEALVEPPGLSSVEVAERLYARLVRKGVRPRQALHFAEGSPNAVVDRKRAGELLDAMLERLPRPKRVLIVPPDFTRLHSGAGELTALLVERLRERAEVDVLPALGTHRPMSAAELEHMFPGVPRDRFLEHDFRRGLTALGEVPASFVRHVSGEQLDYAVRCEISARVVNGGYDRIFSIGQLVPHEVVGIAGHSKNILIGTGGKDSIDRTHFLGAVCGMESMMGRACTPVRDVLSFMAGQFLSALPLTYVLTVRAKDSNGALVTRGLYAGEGESCYYAAAPLVQACNLTLLDEPLERVVVYLDPHEFKSTWLGNKAVYRTRMAIADGGVLTILAPGVHGFGEDPAIDRLIRRHGYHGTAQTLASVERDPEMAATLSAAAHLIHGSSEGRFRIRYAIGGIPAEDVAAVGYEPLDLGPALERYDPKKLVDGMNELPDGERVFYVSNPALGLWGLKRQFE